MQVQQRLDQHPKDSKASAEYFVKELGNAGLLKYFNLAFRADQNRVQLQLRSQIDPSQSCFKVSKLELQQGKKKKTPSAPHTQLTGLIKKVKQHLKSDVVLVATAPLDFIS